MPCRPDPISNSGTPTASQFLAQRGDLLGRNLIFDLKTLVGRRRDIVVDGRKRQVGAAHFAIRQTQSLECLGRSYFVNQVKVDVEQSGLAFGRPHNMRVPHFFKQRS